MRKSMTEQSESKRPFRFDWIFEIAVIATITPALVYGVLTLNNLPVV